MIRKGQIIYQLKINTMKKYQKVENGYQLRFKMKKD